MTITRLGVVDETRAQWNDSMYALHPTPYERGIARWIERARVRAVASLAAVEPDDSVLEVGCESGTLLASLPAGRRMAGADISRRALEDAQARFARLGRTVELFQVDAERGLPFRKGEFDVIVCSEMLEHVTKPAAVVGNIRELCDASTRVIVSVPIEAPKVRIKTALDRLGLLRLIAPNIEPGQSEWHTHAFSPAMLDELLRGLFHTVARRRVWGAHYVVALRQA
jgi:2-polyprenyl-3-methyl-5-hydroxy-6-metoxy-1,4-benzoquinol methylase